MPNHIFPVHMPPAVFNHMRAQWPDATDMLMKIEVGEIDMDPYIRPFMRTASHGRVLSFGRIEDNVPELLKATVWLTIQDVMKVIPRGRRTILKMVVAETWGRVGTWSDLTYVIDETPPPALKRSYLWHHSRFMPSGEVEKSSVAVARTEPKEKNRRRLKVCKDDAPETFSERYLRKQNAKG